MITDMQSTASEPENTKTQRPEKHIRVNYFLQLRLVFGIGILLATIFTAWTPDGLLTSNLAGLLPQLNPQTRSVVPEALTQGDYPTPTPRPRPRIGIVAGHWGNDSGAVCPDGLTEVEINLNIATRVKQLLSQEGFDVDLLEEFDVRLQGYMGLALVSIHADSCTYVNNEATGFKVAAALSSTNPERSSRLTACLRSRYQSITGLSYHAGSITRDMREYHAFDEIHYDTTAAIIEVGFMNLDRQILTEQPDLLATGIAKGVLCHIYNDDLE